MARVDGLEECKKCFAAVKERYFVEFLTRVATDLVKDAWTSKGFQGFTGNTQTSYSCGIYVKGILRYVVSAGDRAKKPVRLKVPKNKYVYLYVPYEGDSRGVQGKVEVDKQYGQQTALNFLRSYKGTPKDGFGLVMTTGTEYSVYLEKLCDLNVLGKTHIRARIHFEKNVKPIK